MLFAQGMVPLRADLHAYRVLPLVVSLWWFERGSHKIRLRGGILSATHFMRPLYDPFNAVWCLLGSLWPLLSREIKNTTAAAGTGRRRGRKNAAP